MNGGKGKVESVDCTKFTSFPLGRILKAYHGEGEAIEGELEMIFLLLFERKVLFHALYPVL